MEKYSRKRMEKYEKNLARGFILKVAVFRTFFQCLIGNKSYFMIEDIKLKSDEILIF